MKVVYIEKKINYFIFFFPQQIPNSNTIYLHKNKNKKS